MTLTRLSLAQFRSWPRLDLDLGGQPLAIHGANGAGKTNILEAVSMLSPGRGLRGAAPGDQARQGRDAGWRIRAVVDGRAVETGALPGESRSVLIDDKAAPQVALGALMRVVWIVPAMDRLWTDAPETRRRFLDRIALSFHPEHADETLAYDKAMRERNRLLRDQVGDAGWYRALESRMAQAGAAITGYQVVRIARQGHGQQKRVIRIIGFDLDGQALQYHSPLQVIDHGAHLGGL